MFLCFILVSRIFSEGGLIVLTLLCDVVCGVIAELVGVFNGRCFDDVICNFNCIFVVISIVFLPLGRGSFERVGYSMLLNFVNRHGFCLEGERLFD